MDLRWYFHRLRKMSAVEVLRRVRDEAWRQAMRVPLLHGSSAIVQNASPALLPSGAQDDAEPGFVHDLLSAADGICRGEWSALGVEWDDLAPTPDWFRDPATGIRSDPDRYAFDMNIRDPGSVGTVKNVWELSRHHHVTILAAAFFVSGDQRYADVAASHLRSWWSSNPFLRGIHWTSGIELGIRLISWVWTRRLLDGWDGVEELFDESSGFVDQLYWHQKYLARFPSHGSSANNHIVAEQAGRLVAACAFPVFAESAAWRRSAAAALEHEIIRQTFPSGLNRELAADYHGFTTELFLAAAIEAERAGFPMSQQYWANLAKMADAGAALLDSTMREPRQGDADQGVALRLDGSDRPRWRSLLPTCERLFGRGDWWAESGETDVRTALWTAGMTHKRIEDRYQSRPHHFADAGVVLLRDETSGRGEIWCRIDAGPFGFLSIAAHAHADALAIELRVGGVDILADPGTFSYEARSDWRTFSRSTRAHNTVEVAGRDQAIQAGPFNWRSHADASTVTVAGLEGGPLARWTGRHRGYDDLQPPVIHERTVTLDRRIRRMTVRDDVLGQGDHPVRLSYHLGPEVECMLVEHAALLTWQAASSERRARVDLPPQLDWHLVKGSMEPLSGWYSYQLGARVPAFSLFGLGRMDDGGRYETVIDLSAA